MKHSKSFIAFQEKTQEIFNFAVLITASVPALKECIGKYKKGLNSRIPDPNYFEPSVIYEIFPETITELQNKGLEQHQLENLKSHIGKSYGNREFKELMITILGKTIYVENRSILKKQNFKYVDNLIDCSNNYQSKLATYLYFSLFSYFEAFILDLAQEVLSSLSYLDGKKYVDNHTENFEEEKNKAKLSNDFDPRKIDRYKKYSAKLKDQGYLTPKEILLSSLLDNLNSKIDNLKASDIPNFLENTFFITFNKKENELYHSLRDNRNSIGHGKKSFTPTIKDVIIANKFFKELSLKIDKQMTQHFFELQNFK